MVAVMGVDARPHTTHAPPPGQAMRGGARPRGRWGDPPHGTARRRALSAEPNRRETPVGRPTFDRDEWDPMVVVPRPPAVATMPPPVQGAALQQWFTTAMQAAGYVWEADHLRPLFWADGGDFNLPELVAATRWWFQLRPLGRSGGALAGWTLGEGTRPLRGRYLGPVHHPPPPPGGHRLGPTGPRPCGANPPPGTSAMGPVAS